YAQIGCIIYFLSGKAGKLDSVDIHGRPMWLNGGSFLLDPLKRFSDISTLAGESLVWSDP
ncbi:MAG: hypothetical protein ACPW60_13495, partial [Methylohalobius sp. ZOD2]